MYEQTSLSTGLVQSMIKRHKQGVSGATPDPDYVGISSMLQACASQTVAYPWEHLVQQVEKKFQQSRKWLWLNNSPLKRLPTNVLGAAMDYLFLVQSLPDDRIMVLDNQIGLVPMIIWAHHILGLNVLVQNSPDGDITFGNSRPTQVIINWDNSWTVGQNNWHEETADPPIPCMFLLDAQMAVVLKTLPDDNQVTDIEGQERLRIEGYGTTCLWRIFNKHSLIDDDDPRYQECAQFVTALAIIAGEKLQRVPEDGAKLNVNCEIPSECSAWIEQWQVITTSNLLFEGINFDRDIINQYVEELRGNHIKDMRLPPSLRNSKELNSNHLKSLSSILLIFSHVIDISTCRGLPLLWSLYYSIVGDRDPAEVKCEFLCIKRGVPFNMATGEHKHIIMDAPRIRPSYRPLKIINEGRVYTPRCMSPVTKRTEYYSSRGSEFWLAIRHDVVDEFATKLIKGQHSQYSIYISYTQMQQALFGVVKTNSCPHTDRENTKPTLDLGCAAVQGFCWLNEPLGDTIKYRICISLVKGDARARWLAVASILSDLNTESISAPDSLERRVMLRHRDCCADCAIERASSLKGKWLIIL